MGYRDDFYKVQNIIGYTGDLHEFPTVYFKKGSEFGHITQKHPNSRAVGRMKVHSSDTYFIGNEMVEGSLKLVEKVDGKIFRIGRGTLTKVDIFHPANKNTVALLARSVYEADHEEKPISDGAKPQLSVFTSGLGAGHVNAAQTIATRLKDLGGNG